MEQLEAAVSLFLLTGPLTVTMLWGRKLLRLLPVPVLLVMSKSFWADYQIERSVFALGGIVLMWLMAVYVVCDARRRHCRSK